MHTTTSNIDEYGNYGLHQLVGTNEIESLLDQIMPPMAELSI
jgi:hypothetical protein